MNILKRLRAACRTNEPQATTVVAITAMSGMALALRVHDTPLWFIVIVLLFWPTLAFVFNLLDPIPKPVIDND